MREIKKSRFFKIIKKILYLLFKKKRVKRMRERENTSDKAYILFEDCSAHIARSKHENKTIHHNLYIC